MLDCMTTSEDEVSVPLPASKPFAILLRLRVTQIVAGIVIVLLGAVACLEESTRVTLGLGIPAGVLTVLSAVSHIQVSRREYTAGMLSIPAITAYTNSGALLRPLSALRPFLPTLACVMACLLLLSLSVMSLTSDNQNRVVLGCLQVVTSAVVLVTEAVVWICRWRWTKN